MGLDTRRGVSGPCRLLKLQLMTQEEFAYKMKTDPRLMLGVIVAGNREGVISVLKAYQVPVPASASDDLIIDKVIEMAKVCQFCLIEVLTLKIDASRLPEGYAEALDELGYLGNNQMATKSTTRGAPTDYMGPTYIHNGVMYVWRDGDYVAMGGTTTPSTGSEQQEDGADTGDEGNPLDWNQVIAGGLGTIIALFGGGSSQDNDGGSGTGSGDGSASDPPANNGNKNNDSDKKRKQAWTIAIVLGLILITIAIIYIVKNR